MSSRINKANISFNYRFNSVLVELSQIFFEAFPVKRIVPINRNPLYIFTDIKKVIKLLFFLGILYHAEDNFLFYPELPSHSRVFVPIPSMYGLPYENVQVRAADGTLLKMFFIYQPPERLHQSPTIIFFHGNAGNMGHRLQNAVGLYHNLHCNILLVEYRGYGLSEGSPTEEGLYIDAKASIDYLLSRSDVNLSEIIIFGRSLGKYVFFSLISYHISCTYLFFYVRSQWILTYMGANCTKIWELYQK